MTDLSGQLAVLKTLGKSIVYADESDFRQESHRHYAYVPRCEVGSRWMQGNTFQ